MSQRPFVFRSLYGCGKRFSVKDGFCFSISEALIGFLSFSRLLSGVSVGAGDPFPREFPF